MSRDRATSAIGAFILAWACLIALCVPPSAFALHNADPDGAAGPLPGLSCYDCHTLGIDTGAADSDVLPNSSFINRRVRTLPTMLARGFTPDGTSGRDFACVFCHSTQSTNTIMKDVVTDFSSQSHKHPVGADYTNNPWTDTNWEWLSNGIVASSAGNLQCTGCHDPALLVYSYLDNGVTKYAYEHLLTGWNKTVNPYALRDGNAATPQNGGNPATGSAEIAEFCTRLCHNGSSSQILVTSKNGHAASTAPNTVRGIQASLSNCLSCHRGHYADQVDLIPSTLATPTNCRGCHKTPNYDGAQQTGTDGTTYYSGGHGKQRKLNLSGTLGGTILYSCTQCHDSNIPHDFTTGENRIPWDEATDQCGVCHDGTARNHIAGGTTYQCNTCHDPHGDGTGTNMWMVRTSVATPNSGTMPVVLTARTGANSFDDGATGGENSLCSACHTLTPGGTTHNNNTQDGVTHVDGNNYESQNCAVSCHPHNGTSAFQQQCDGCHGYPPPPAFGGRSEAAHPEHNAAPYGFDCTKCHSGYSHQDFTIDVHKAAETPTNQNPSWPVGSYTSLSNDTCDSTNCHNPYRLDGDAATNNNPHWGDTNTQGCSFCHTGKSSGAHEQHTAKGYACTVCHQTWSTTSDHVKGTLQTTGLINLSLPAGIPVQPTQSFNETNSQCFNLHCHGNFDPTRGGLNFSPRWSVPADGDCGTCHASPPNTGMHTLHLSGAMGPRADCSSCHGPGAEAGTHATHVDGTLDLGTLGETLATTTRCDGCHGNNPATDSERLLAKYFWGRPQGSWAASTSPAGTLVGNGDPTIAGGSGYCQWCHDGTPSVVSTATGTNGNTMTAADAESNWDTDNGGHGYPGTSTATGNTMPGYGCSDCHNVGTTGTHINGTVGDNDRLQGSLTRLTACADCHAPNQSGPGPVLGKDATVEASNHMASVTGKYSNPAYNYACVACHNPHGTTNIAMMRTSITDNMGQAANNVTLLAETGLDPDAGPDNGVCDRCHADGVQAHSLTVNPNNHNYGSACLQCHDHTRSFEGSCSTCHGSSTAQTSWPQGAGNARNLYPNRAGRHPLHVQRLGERLGYGANPLAYDVPQQRAICDFCHNDPTGLSGSPGHFPIPYAVGNEPADVGSFNQMWGSYAADGGIVAAYVDATYSGNNWAGGSGCNAVDCHNTKDTASGYEWYASSATGCTLCHATVTSTAIATGQTHRAHTDAQGNGLGIDIQCWYCHLAGTETIAWGSPGTAPSIGHVNGTFLTTGAFSYAFSYSGVYPTTPGGCGTNRCHNNGQNGAPLASTYSWGTTVDGTGSCTECHNATSAALATFSHPAHLTTSTGAGAQCGNCHAAGSNPTHMNAVVDFASGITYTPAAAASVTVNPTAVGGCGTNLCHNNGQNGAPLASTYSWGTAINGTNSCTECHNATTATLVTLSHPAHLTTSTGGAAAAQCLACHAAAGANTHADGSVTMANIGSAYPASATAVVTGASVVGGCGTNFCHNNGQNGPPLQPTYSWGTAINGTNSCTECHNATTATLVTLSHAAHLTSSIGQGAQCGDCHAAASAPSHWNGSITMAGIGSAYPSSATEVITGGSVVAGCGINLCHNDGQNGTPLQSGYVWGNVIGGTNSCTECHNATPSTLATLSHAPHLTTSTGAGAQCADCHAGASAATHGNGSVTMAGIGSVYPASATDVPAGGSVVAGCGTNICHNDGQNAAPVQPGYSWGTAINGTNSCTECHGATQTTLTTLSHAAHLTTATGLGAVCDNCHAAAFATTHANGSVTMGSIGTAYPASATVVAAGGGAVGGCGTNLCHNNGQNGAPLASNYSWGTAINGTNSCTECHATTTLATFSHDEHLGAAVQYGVSVDCISCHAGYVSLTHGDGSVTMSGGGSNYPPAATPVAAGGGTLGGCGTNVCHNNGYNGGVRTPAYTWGTAVPLCQECHGDTGGTLTTNAHPTHNTAAYGPQTTCGNCHAGATVSTHINGSATFSDGANLSGTSACNSCHAGSTGTAVSEWPLGAGHWLNTAGGYCEHCHDNTPSVVNTQAGTGGVNMTAWGAMGDGSTYGAAVRGHGKTSGGYTDADSIQTNVAANRPCTACHSSSSTHINGTNDTDYAGNRLLATVNNVATGSTVSGLCNACHTGQGTAPSSSPVSSHGNQNASYVAPLRDTAGAEGFTYRCEACHEPHGVVNGAGYVNIYMIRPSIGVGSSFTTLPGGTDQTTVTVRLQRISGTDSFDDTNDGSRIDNVCYACHVNSNRPGSGTSLRTSGGDHTGNSGPLKSNERGKNCVNCHMHSLDNDFGGTADGFMPLECDSCHTYPSLATKPSTHRMTGPHDEHAGRPSDETQVGNKGFSCNTCHYLFNHNQSNFSPGTTWDNTNVPPANINIRFDPNWNPGTPTYNAADAWSQFAPGISTHNGQCAGLYCHSPGGTGTNPSWTGTLSACTACHADTTNTMATQSHAAHLTTSTGSGAQCADCHTSYDLASTGNHMNGSVTFVATLTYTGNTVDKIPTSGQGDCAVNVCHNNGQTGLPISPYTWGSSVNGTNSCTECHNATSATLATLSHAPHLTTSTGQGAQCDNCHAGASANTHANGSVTLAAYASNYPPAATPVAAGGGTLGGCGTNLCHNNGQNGSPAQSGYSWGTGIDGTNSCTECHATGTISTFSHPPHLTTSTGAGAGCDNCHTAASANTHGNGSVTFAAEITYTPASASSVQVSATAVGGCGTNVCHNNGQNAAPLASTYSWGTSINGTNSCTECHATGTLSTLSHPPHLLTSTGAGAGCDNCHASASANTHGNGSVTFAAAITYTPASASSVTVSPTAIGGCGTNICHNNGQNAAPLVATYSWGTSINGTNSCTECHSATTALATFSHDEHLLAATLFGITTVGCPTCHAGASANTHADGSVTLAAGGSNYPPAATPVAASGGTLAGCGTNSCHNDGQNGSPRTAYTWGTTIGNCQECHGDTTAATTTGSHPSHFNAVWGAALGSCATCHTAATVTAHLNGTVNLVTAPGNTTPTDLAGSSVCNSCHGIVTYDGETIKAEWPDTAANTYTPGSANPDVTCESCHGSGDMLAWQNANGTGGRAPSKTANFTSTGHGLSSGSTYNPSGRAGAGANCLSCHNEASAHLSATAGDTDRLDAAGNALCHGCHDGAGTGSAVTQVTTHGNRSATMGSPPASYTRQRAQFELDCVECHDAHGNTNIFMINTASPNGPLSSSRWLNNSQSPTPTNIFNGTVNFQDDTVGTSASAGVGFANTAADASKICQTCHTSTGGTYQHNQATTGHATSLCTACHAHDVDDNFASNSQDAFMPKGDCEDCHNGNTAYPLAPNVMTYWTGSSGSIQDGGHGDPQGLDRTAPPKCDDCHDISAPSGTHLNGTYDSIWANNSTRNANTAHLKTEYFSRSAPPSLPVGSGAWSVQVTFDRYCAEKCHQNTTTWVTSPVQDMVHEKDTSTSDSNHWSVEFGTHLTYTNGDTRPYPIDVDLNTGAAGGADYATCASCHDPHGTGVSEPAETEGENHMLRDQWITNTALCDSCHN